MNVGALLIAHSESAPLEEPFEARLHDVAQLTQTAAVFRIAFSDQWHDARFAQRSANLGFCIVCPISQQVAESASSRASRLSDRRTLLNDIQCRYRVVDVRSRMLDGPRQAVAFRQQMPLRARFAAIRRVRAGIRPPKIARTEQLSSTPTSNSNSPACPSSSSMACQILAHTSDFCQSRNRRQHVIPQPHPISFGRYSQGQPVFSTNKIPVRQSRSETGGRPPFGRGGLTGRRDSIRAHNSSDTNTFATISPP